MSSGLVLVKQTLTVMVKLSTHSLHSTIIPGPIVLLGFSGKPQRKAERQRRVCVHVSRSVSVSIILIIYTHTHSAHTCAWVTRSKSCRLPGKLKPRPFKELHIGPTLHRNAFPGFEEAQANGITALIVPNGHSSHPTLYKFYKHQQSSGNGGNIRPLWSCSRCGYGAVTRGLTEM